MNCERTSTLLSAYLDEALPARDAGRVAGHLARCASCRQELADLERSIAVLNGVSLRTPPIDLWERFAERLAADGRTPVPSRWQGVIGGRWIGALRPAPGVALAGLALFLGVAACLIGVGSDGSRAAILAQSLVSPADGVSSRMAWTEAPTAASATSGQGVERRDLSPGPARIIATIIPPDAQPDRPVQIQPRPTDLASVVARAPASSAADSPAAREQVANAGPALDGPLEFPTGGGVHLKSVRRGNGDPGSVGSPLDATMGVAAAIQASVETTMGQEVASEVLLLAQALDRHHGEPSGAPTTGDEADGS